jgi:hypothetical protein
VEERDRSGRMTQRKFDVDARPPVAPASKEPPAAAPPPPPKEATRPSVPSNQALLERQLKWLRERSRFNSRRTEDGEPK